MILSYLAGPLVGSVIGYCTNYLAVKMLFYPKKEVHLLGHKLPFTPGAIPKGKPRLSKAIGEIVGNTLLTKEDIKNQFLGEEMEAAVIERVMNRLSGEMKAELLHLTNLEEAAYEKGREKLLSIFTDEILDSLDNIQIGDIIAEEGGKVIREKVKGSFLEMMLSDSFLESITGMLGDSIEQYIQENGKTYIRPELEHKFTALEEASVIGLMEKADVSDEMVQAVIRSIYRSIVEVGMDKLVSHISISEIAEEKINAMDVDELEALVLSVMKKELDTIVNLGALIGFLLGALNLIF